MYDDYYDKPVQVEQYLDQLTDIERRAFDTGYALALCSVLEQISESKHKLYNKLMDLPEDLDEEQEEWAKMQLESRLLLLDVYEKHYKLRAKFISKRCLQQKNGI